MINRPIGICLRWPNRVQAVNIPTQTRPEFGFIQSITFSRCSVKLVSQSPLLRILTAIFWVSIYKILISSFCTASQRECCFTSMCSDFLWKTRLVDSLTALWLSSPRNVGCCCECCKSHNICWRNYTSCAAAARLWFSVSQLESATVCCFLTCQDIAQLYWPYLK